MSDVWPDPEGQPLVSYVNLKKLKFYSIAVINPVLEAAQISAVRELYSENMVMRLAACVMGQEEQLVNEKWPMTWWDAVKDRWCPLWLRRWVRVSYRIIHIDKQTLVPSFTIPKHDPVVRLNVMSRSYRSRSYRSNLREDDE